MSTTHPLDDFDAGDVRLIAVLQAERAFLVSQLEQPLAKTERTALTNLVERLNLTINSYINFVLDSMEQG